MTNAYLKPKVVGRWVQMANLYHYFTLGAIILLGAMTFLQEKGLKQVCLRGGKVGRNIGSG